MKKCALIAVSEKGAFLASRVAPCLASFDAVEIYVLEKYAQSERGHIPFTSTGELAARLWPTHRALVFLCASGIAVRAIAPLVASKFTDPAVVVTADSGAFSVSLLSGHEGGANALSLQVAAAIGDSVPVISTASECSPAIRPRNLFVGVGCTRGMSGEKITAFIEKIFAERRLSLLRVRSLATIDLKKDEAGLAQAAEALEAPLLFFTSAELGAVEGNFSASEYVKKVTGVDNVCERAAAAASGGPGRLIVPKIAADGMTVAVFCKEKEEKNG